MPYQANQTIGIDGHVVEFTTYVFLNNLMIANRNPYYERKGVPIIARTKLQTLSKETRHSQEVSSRSLHTPRQLYVVKQQVYGLNISQTLNKTDLVCNMKMSSWRSSLIINTQCL